MKKTAKVVSVGAVAVQLLALLIFLFVVIFQRQVKMATGAPEDIISFFVWPVASTLFMLCMLVSVALPMVGSFVSWRAPVLEIAAIVLLAAVCPLVNNVGGTLESMVKGNYQGVQALAAYGSLSSALAIPTGISGLASALGLVSAGMGIAVKRISAKM